MSVSPNSGLLKPGVSQACKVTFTALGPPSFFDIDLVCEVGGGYSSSPACVYLCVEEHLTVVIVSITTLDIEEYILLHW